MHGIVFQKPMVSLVLVVLVVVGGGGGGVTTRVVLSDDFFADADVLGSGEATVTVGAADVTAGVGVGSAETAATMGLSG